MTLIHTTKTFHSPSVNGLHVVEKLAFAEKPTRPTIMSKKLVLGKKTLAEVSIKELSNGLKFESYNSSGDTIKLIKDKFGNYLSFKSNIKNYNFDPKRLVENMKLTIRQKLSSVHNNDLYIRKDYKPTGS